MKDFTDKTIIQKILKLFKKSLAIYIVVFFITQYFSSCFSFKLSQKQIDEQFSSLSLKPVQHHIISGDRSINYAEIGNDSLPVVIFVHGSPGSWSAFIDFMKDSLLLTKVKIVSVDRPGFGESDFGVGEKDLKKQAQYLRPIVAKYKANNKKIILIGHSLGGPLIMRMAMDYPELIDAMIMVAGAVSPYLEPNEKWFRIPLQFLPLKVLLPKSYRASNEELLYLKPELMKMLPLWKNITQPVTIIQGNNDHLVDPKNADFAKKELIHSVKIRTVIIQDMTHFVPWTHPDLIKKAIYENLP